MPGKVAAIIEEIDWAHTGTVFEPVFENDPWEELMLLVRGFQEEGQVAD